MPRIPERGRHITQEPQTIATHLLGRSLASFRRRMFAYFCDLLLFGVITGAVFAGLTAWSFHREDSTLFSRARAVSPAPDDPEAQLAYDRVRADFYYMVWERCPDAYSHHLTEMVRQRDMPALQEYFRDRSLTIGFGQGKTRLTDKTDGSSQMIIGMDLLMGPLAGMLGWGGFFVGWFTFWPWVTRGRSPGKALARIRVVRLEGGKLRLWDCFGRAAGYSASTATLLLGFFEAIWHPNRQAIHDKIAGTVVVRD